MRVEVDLSRCQGYGNCVSTAPDIFDLSDAGTVLVIKQPELDDEAATRAAANLCPVSAISIIEEAAD
jgi:ferredoxin